MRKLNGVLYIVVSSSAFGIMPVLAKIVYKQGVSQYTVLCLRFLFAAAMLLYYLLANKISLKITKVQLLFTFFLGAFGYSSTALCMFSSYKYISVGLATTILYAYPAIVTLISFILYKEKLYFAKVIALLVSLLGIYVLVGFNNTSFNMIGVSLSLAASIFYSIYVIGVSSSNLKKIDSFLLTFYISLFSGITILFGGLISNKINLNINFYSIVTILLIAFISTVIALMTFIKGVKLIGPSKASILSTLEPIVSVIFGYIILNESISLQMLIGGLLVLSSVVILTFKSENIPTK